MEPQTQQTQTNASPEPASSPRGFQRCRAHNRSGSRCRLHVQDPATGLCFRHSARLARTADALPDSTDLSAEIFAAERPVFETAEDINVVLSNIVILIAQGRISSRRAAVITYALSLILRSLVVADRKAASQPPEIILDAPRPDRSQDKTAASTQPNGEASAEAATEASAKERFDASERYSRLRT